MRFAFSKNGWPISCLKQKLFLCDNAELHTLYSWRNLNPLVGEMLGYDCTYCTDCSCWSTAAVSSLMTKKEGMSRDCIPTFGCLHHGPKVPISDGIELTMNAHLNPQGKDCLSTLISLTWLFLSNRLARKDWNGNWSDTAHGGLLSFSFVGVNCLVPAVMESTCCVQLNKTLPGPWALLCGFGQVAWRRGSVQPSHCDHTQKQAMVCSGVSKAGSQGLAAKGLGSDGRWGDSGNFFLFLFSCFPFFCLFVYFVIFLLLFFCYTMR